MTGPSVVSFAFASFTRQAAPSNGSRQQVSRLRWSISRSDRLPPAQIYNIAKKVSQPNNPVKELVTSQPSIVPLTHDILLPFANRTSEVATLVADRRNATFIRLLKGAFANRNSAPERTAGELFAFPDTWSHRELETWLFRVTREEVKDYTWCLALQAAVLPKSATLWERLKALLGIPPEIIAVTVSQTPALRPALPDRRFRPSSAVRAHWRGRSRRRLRRHP